MKIQIAAVALAIAFAGTAFLLFRPSTSAQSVHPRTLVGYAVAQQKPYSGLRIVKEAKGMENVIITHVQKHATYQTEFHVPQGSALGPLRRTAVVSMHQNQRQHPWPWKHTK